MFGKGMFFGMISDMRSIRSITLLHLDIIGVEFNVLGAVKDAFGVIIGIGRNGSRALTTDCGGEVCVGIGLVGRGGRGAGRKGEEGEVRCEEGAQAGGVGAEDAGC